MLVFQVSLEQGSRFSDMPHEVFELSKKAGYALIVGTYHYKEGGVKDYQRLLVQRKSDGKLFDYRIYGKELGDEGHWVDQARWNRLLGSNFATEIDGKEVKIEPETFMKKPRGLPSRKSWTSGAGKR